MTRYKTDIRDRARAFGVAAYRFTKATGAAHSDLRGMCGQLLASSTSIGANLAESAGANSRRELAARYAIAMKEARESAYWLDLLREAEPTLTDAIIPLLAECKELIAMTTAALKKLRP